MYTCTCSGYVKLTIICSRLRNVFFLFLCSFSHSGGVLCGAGKDRHSKSQVVVWNTSRVTHSGEVCVLARAHTDVNIERMRVAAFDDSRYSDYYTS